MHIQSRAWNRVFLLVDAAAISFWATAGALKTLEVGLEWLPAVLLGTITAIGGGVTRDLMLQRVPAVFKDGQLYATVAIVVAIIQVVFAETLGLHYSPARWSRSGRVPAPAARLLARLAAADRPRLGAEQDPPARHQAPGIRRPPPES